MGLMMMLVLMMMMMTMMIQMIMLRLMLMPSMVLTAMVLVDFMEDMDTLVLAMPDTDMLLLMPMVLTMERGLLTLSLRLMPTMVLTVLATAMVVSMEDMESVPMVPTPMPMVSMESKMTIPSNNRVAHQVQTEAQKQTFETNLTF